MPSIKTYSTSMKIFLSIFLMTLFALSAQGQIIINEISYNPCTTQGSDGDCEYIEIYNSAATAVDVSGWAIDDPVFTFPAGTMMAAGEYVLVTENGNFGSCAWENAVPAGVQMFSWTTGNLGNSGESLTLSDGGGAAQNTFTYDDGPCGADGDCNSLQYNGMGDNADCTNWITQLPTPGASNQATPPDCLDLMLNIGDACDDMDASTLNDIVQMDCTCVGTLPDCVDLVLNIGDPCDDMDAATFDDIVQMDCTCAGTPADCAGLGLNIGDPCDDNDPTTIGDTVKDDCTCSGTTPGGSCPGMFINEFAYDCGDADMNEVIEVAVPNTFTGNLADIQIDLYNGNGNSIYTTTNLSSFSMGANDGIYTYYTLTGTTIQNGAPDGIALSYQGGLCEFLTYEGTITAANGPAQGITSTDVGVSQNNGTMCDETIQLFGGVWVNACGTPGGVNIGTLCGEECPGVSIGDPCDDGDANTINDAIQADCTCAGVVDLCPGIAGTFGDTCDDGDPNTINDVIQEDCSCAGIIPGECPGAFISEFAYDCDNADMNEAIEVCVPNTFTGNIADIQIDLYNGNNGTTYNTITLDMFTIGTNNGFSTYYTWAGSGSDIQNGAPDGLALSFQGSNCEFLSYEGMFNATNGPAVGLTSLDIGVAQSNGTSCDQTLQFFNCEWIGACATLGDINNNQQCIVTYDCPNILVNFGDGCNDGDANTENDIIQMDCTCMGTPIVFDCPDIFTNIGDACNDENPNTIDDIIQSDCTCLGTDAQFDCTNLAANTGDTCDDGDPNTGFDMVQADCTCAGLDLGGECPGAFITEFGYDCDDNDMNEVVEVTIPNSYMGALSDLIVYLYNGNGATVYDSLNLADFMLITDNGDFSIYTFVPSSIQNGAPDALAFAFQDRVCQFISYEGTLQATDGPAVGQTSVDVGVEQSNATPCDQTIQLINMTQWVAACATPGDFNTGEVECPEPFDCPEQMAYFGDPCDDGDLTTTNDVYLEDCTCVGEPFDCPDLLADIGDPCDDGDANTNNDEFQDDCTCAGTPFDCPNIMAYIGDDCNDNDETTTNDQVQDDCTCSGTPPDCPMQMLNIGDACDDGNSNTMNDIVQSDCTCVGSLIMQADCMGAFISEFAYACNVNDENEIVEIAVPNAYTGSLAALALELYDNNGMAYSSMTVDMLTTNTNDGVYTYYTLTGVPINNGTGAISLSFNGVSCEFISYGGTVTGTDGNAQGFVSTDLGLTQDDTTFCELSIQYVDCQWTSSCSTGGNINVNSMDCTNIFDCPTLMLDISDSCDDGNPVSMMDTVQPDCTCAGIIGCMTGDIIITEINYNPCSDIGSDSGYEFIELYNNGATDVSLEDWQMDEEEGAFGATSYTFPAIVIPAGGYLVIAVDATTYDGTMGLTLGVNLLDWDVSLSNIADEIVLYDCDGNLVDAVFYDDDGIASDGFPECADGDNAFCATLALPTSNYNADNNINTNWQVQTNGGSPGVVNTTMTCDGMTPCSIIVSSEEISICDDNGTPDDMTDDTFTITVTATVANGSGSYAVNDGTNTSAATASGTSVVLGPYSADGSTTINLTYSDASDATCSFSSAPLGPVEVCSIPASCSIAIDSEVVSVCNNNNTPTDPADDTFTITVTATVTNGSGSYIVNDGTNTSAAMASGISIVLGPYPADGSTTINLTYSDASDMTCTTNSATLGPINVCSAPACENTFIQNFPANNGQ